MVDVDEVYARLIRLLADRSHSEAEIRRKLKTRKFGEADIDDAVVRARESGYLDDSRFADEFARYGRDRKGWAPARTELELQKRGVARDLIDAAVNQAFAETELIDQARALARARAAKLTGDTESRRRRLANFLSRRGYSASVCHDVVDEVAPL